MIRAKLIIRNHKGAKEQHMLEHFNGSLQEAYSYAKEALPQAKVLLMLVPKTYQYIEPEVA